MWLKDREFLEERLAVRDLPAEKLLLTPEEHDMRMAKMQQSQAQDKDLATRDAEAKIKETISSAILNLANAEKAEEGTQLEAYKQILATLETLNGANNTAATGGSNQPTASLGQRPSSAGFGVSSGL